jgi:biopolymer transport protein TolR
MAFSNSGSSGSAKKFSTPTALAEINVTPLVDIMLVLLIVFMISAPLMQQGIPVDLPKAHGTATGEDPQAITLNISKERQVEIGGVIVPPRELASKLSAMVEARPDLQVTVQADQSLSYGFVAQIMGEIRRARVTKVGLATQPGELQD